MSQLSERIRPEHPPQEEGEYRRKKKIRHETRRAEAFPVHEEDIEKPGGCDDGDKNAVYFDIKCHGKSYCRHDEVDEPFMIHQAPQEPHIEGECSSTGYPSCCYGDRRNTLG